MRVARRGAPAREKPRLEIAGLLATFCHILSCESSSTGATKWRYCYYNVLDKYTKTGEPCYRHYHMKTIVPPPPDLPLGSVVRLQRWMMTRAHFCMAERTAKLTPLPTDFLTYRSVSNDLKEDIDFVALLEVMSFFSLPPERLRDVLDLLRERPVPRKDEKLTGEEEAAAVASLRTVLAGCSLDPHAMSAFGKEGVWGDRKFEKPDPYWVQAAHALWRQEAKSESPPTGPGSMMPNPNTMLSLYILNLCASQGLLLDPYALRQRVRENGVRYSIIFDGHIWQSYPAPDVKKTMSDLPSCYALSALHLVRKKSPDARSDLESICSDSELYASPFPEEQEDLPRQQQSEDPHDSDEEEEEVAYEIHKPLRKRPAQDEETPLFLRQVVETVSQSNAVDQSPWKPDTSFVRIFSAPAKPPQKSSSATSPPQPLKSLLGSTEYPLPNRSPTATKESLFETNPTDTEESPSLTVSDAASTENSSPDLTEHVSGKIELSQPNEEEHFSDDNHQTALLEGIRMAAKGDGEEARPANFLLNEAFSKGLFAASRLADLIDADLANAAALESNETARAVMLGAKSALYPPSWPLVSTAAGAEDFPRGSAAQSSEEEPGAGEYKLWTTPTFVPADGHSAILGRAINQ